MRVRPGRFAAATSAALCAALTVGVLGAAPTVSTAAGAAAGASARSRPNIVMIMVDDMRNDELRFMPWTRRLIRDRGVRFVSSFSPNPLCCPARASALTGRYTHNHRVFDVVAPWGFTSFRDRSTIATWLRRAGYATVYLGKYLNGYGYMPRPGHTTGKSLHYVPPGWSDWRASIDWGLPDDDPQAGGTYQFFDTTISANGHGFRNFAGRYQSRVYGELSERIIRQRAAADRPFFFYASYTAPHHGGPPEPDDPAPVRGDDGIVTTWDTTARPVDVRGRFDRKVTAAPGADWKDPDFSDKPAYLHRSALNGAERRALLEVTRQRAEALWVVDRQVKRTIDALRSTGELGNTFVMFTSDNGYYLGEQRRRQGKVFFHEPSLRVPMLLRGPGIPAGARRKDPFTSVDIAPTIARFAGVEPARRIDGRSLLGVARRGDRGWTRGILTESKPFLEQAQRDTDEAGHPLGPGDVRDIRYAIGVRTRRYLYVDIATGEEELYDVIRDPEEYRNLVGRPAYEHALTQLRQVLAGLRACDRAACREPLPPGLDAAP